MLSFNRVVLVSCVVLCAEIAIGAVITASNGYRSFEKLEVIDRAENISHMAHGNIRAAMDLVDFVVSRPALGSEDLKEIFRGHGLIGINTKLGDKNKFKLSDGEILGTLTVRHGEREYHVSNVKFPYGMTPLLWVEPQFDSNIESVLLSPGDSGPLQHMKGYSVTLIDSETGEGILLYPTDVEVGRDSSVIETKTALVQWQEQDLVPGRDILDTGKYIYAVTQGPGAEGDKLLIGMPRAPFLEAVVHSLPSIWWWIVALGLPVLLFAIILTIYNKRVITSANRYVKFISHASIHGKASARELDKIETVKELTVTREQVLLCTTSMEQKRVDSQVEMRTHAYLNCLNEYYFSTFVNERICRDECSDAYLLTVFFAQTKTKGMSEMPHERRESLKRYLLSLELAVKRLNSAEDILTDVRISYSGSNIFTLWCRTSMTQHELVKELKLSVDECGGERITRGSGVYVVSVEPKEDAFFYEDLEKMAGYILGSLTGQGSWANLDQTGVFSMGWSDSYNSLRDLRERKGKVNPDKDLRVVYTPYADVRTGVIQGININPVYIDSSGCETDIIDYLESLPSLRDEDEDLIIHAIGLAYLHLSAIKITGYKHVFLSLRMCNSVFQSHRVISGIVRLQKHHPEAKLVIEVEHEDMGYHQYYAIEVLQSAGIGLAIAGYGEGRSSDVPLDKLTYVTFRPSAYKYSESILGGIRAVMVEKGIKFLREPSANFDVDSCSADHADWIKLTSQSNISSHEVINLLQRDIKDNVVSIN